MAFFAFFCISLVVAVQAAQSAIPLSLVIAVDPSKIHPGDKVEKDQYEGNKQQIQVVVHKDIGE